MAGRRGPGARGTTLTLQSRLPVPKSYEFNHIPPGITGVEWGLAPECNCSETTRKQRQVKGRAHSLPRCCRKTRGGSGCLAQRRAVKGEPLPKTPSADRGAEEKGLFPGGGSGRLCGTIARCAPSAPAQLRRTCAAFTRAIAAGRLASSEPFREQATKSSESRRGRVGMKSKAKETVRFWDQDQILTCYIKATGGSYQQARTEEEQSPGPAPKQPC